MILPYLLQRSFKVSRGKINRLSLISHTLKNNDCKNRSSNLEVPLNLLFLSQSVFFIYWNHILTEQVSKIPSFKSQFYSEIVIKKIKKQKNGIFIYRPALTSS